MNKKQMFIDYVSRFIGRPYIWGGDGSNKGTAGNRAGGFDCSGLMLEGLWAFGLIPKGDRTADGILNFARKNWTEATQNDDGALLFFGTSKKATHTALSIGGGFMIEAGGGGSKCTAGDNSTGFIRIRPTTNRSDLLGAFMPNF